MRDNFFQKRKKRDKLVTKALSLDVFYVVNFQKFPRPGSTHYSRVD